MSAYPGRPVRGVPGWGATAGRRRDEGRSPVTGVKASKRVEVGSRRSAADSQWRSIKVRQLAALAAVAYEGSFRRAAQRLGYVQSAISNQIAQLERAAGTRLVERASGSSAVTLTHAGRVLVTHIDEIIARLEDAYVDVSSLASTAAGVVRVAGMDRFAPRRVALILRRFREVYPLGRVVLEDVGSDELIFELLEAGALDVAVSELPIIEGPFAYVVLEHDPFVLLVCPDSPLAAGAETTTATELASLRLIVPGCCRASAQLGARLDELGIQPHSLFAPDTIATAQALVGIGLGAAVVPRSLFDPSHPKAVAIELPDLLPERTTIIAFHAKRECSPTVDGFVQAVTEACKAAEQRPLTRR